LFNGWIQPYDTAMSFYKLSLDEWKCWANWQLRGLLKKTLCEQLSDRLPIQLRGPSGQMLGTLREAGLAPLTGVGLMGPSATSPDTCACREWTKPSPAEHHPICVNRHDWENWLRTLALSAPPAPEQAAPQLEPAQKPESEPLSQGFFLYTAEDGLLLREATSAEVEQAHCAAVASGLPMIELDGSRFVVAHGRLPGASHAACSASHAALNP
jgi:hypothetical protein